MRLHIEVPSPSEIVNATISRIERGHAEGLRPETLRRLARALRVSSDYLIDIKDEITIEDTLAADDDARYIFRGYENLTPRQRLMLKQFLEMLEAEDKDGPKRE